MTIQDRFLLAHCRFYQYCFIVCVWIEKHSTKMTTFGRMISGYDKKYIVLQSDIPSSLSRLSSVNGAFSSFNGSQLVTQHQLHQLPFNACSKVTHVDPYFKDLGKLAQARDFDPRSFDVESLSIVVWLQNPLQKAHHNVIFYSTTVYVNFISLSTLPPPCLS